MAAATTVVMMGMALASGAAAYSSSRTQAKRAEAQSKISARQGELELKRSAQSAKEAMLELEDAREYQQWKSDFVTPLLNKSIEDPRKSDAAQLRAGQNLGRGIQVEQAKDTIAQGVTGAGFDFGGSRHGAADAELTGAQAGANQFTQRSVDRSGSGSGLDTGYLKIRYHHNSRSVSRSVTRCGRSFFLSAGDTGYRCCG